MTNPLTCLYQRQGPGIQYTRHCRDHEADETTAYSGASEVYCSVNPPHFQHLCRRWRRNITNNKITMDLNTINRKNYNVQEHSQVHRTDNALFTKYFQAKCTKMHVGLLHFLSHIPHRKLTSQCYMTTHGNLTLFVAIVYRCRCSMVRSALYIRTGSPNVYLISIRYPGLT